MARGAHAPSRVAVGAPADRKREYFHKEIAVANGGGPLCQEVTNTAGVARHVIVVGSCGRVRLRRTLIRSSHGSTECRPTVIGGKAHLSFEAKKDHQGHITRTISTAS